MEPENILEILNDKEMTQDQIADIIVGQPALNDKSKSGYMKIAAQILVENKLEFLLNEMVQDNTLGVKKVQDGLVEHICYYAIDDIKVKNL
ncbi:hypothetical protein [Ferroplasma sp.]|uniref:hypothetical protein n=1 Tax=Ferroplasma sp. TaxID=2591003 RepID=UPI00307F48F0